MMGLRKHDRHPCPGCHWSYPTSVPERSQTLVGYDQWHPGKLARRATLVPLLAVWLLILSGCRDDMYDQPKYKPLSKGSHLIGPTSALAPPEGTVARSEPTVVGTIETGMSGDKLAEDLPFPLTRKVLERGRERYAIYCTPCHGGTGDGRGMIVERGFSPPPSFDSQELRDAPIGHFYDVINRGHGAMYAYDARVKTEDRWAISAYIRALQWSRNVDERALPEPDRAKLREVAR